MNGSDVQSWLDRYVAAWRSNAEADIAALFTDDVVYRYRPYGGEKHVSSGRAALLSDWLEQPDAPDSWDARYEPYAVEGDRAVAIGTSHYVATADQPERTYHNAFMLRFAPDGRCAEFTEYYMLEQ